VGMHKLSFIKNSNWFDLKIACVHPIPKKLTIT